MLGGELDEVSLEVYTVVHRGPLGEGMRRLWEEGGQRGNRGSCHAGTSKCREFFPCRSRVIHDTIALASILFIFSLAFRRAWGSPRMKLLPIAIIASGLWSGFLPGHARTALR